LAETVTGLELALRLSKKEVRMSGRIWAQVMLLLGTMGWAERARAEPPQATLVRPEPVHDQTATTTGTQQEWYGSHTLAADAIPASLFLLTIPVDNDSEAGFWGAGAFTFAVGAPAVHVAHGRPWTALGSLGLRLSVPIVGMFFGAQIDGSMPLKCSAMMDCEMSTTYLTAGGLIGAAAVSAIDASLLAFERVPEREVAASPAVTLSPVVALTERGGRLGLLGSF
jgi:hypothetical protein